MENIAYTVLLYVSVVDLESLGDYSLPITTLRNTKDYIHVLILKWTKTH